MSYEKLTTSKVLSAYNKPPTMVNKALLNTAKQIQNLQCLVSTLHLKQLLTPRLTDQL